MGCVAQGAHGMRAAHGCTQQRTAYVHKASICSLGARCRFNECCTTATYDLIMRSVPPLPSGQALRDPHSLPCSMHSNPTPRPPCLLLLQALLPLLGLSLLSLLYLLGP